MADFTPFEKDSPEAKRFEAAFAPPVPAPEKGSVSSGQLFSSPQGFYGPGFLANLESKVTGKSPEQAYATRVPQLETATNVMGSLLAPGKTLLGRMAGQAGVSGGLKALSGAGPLKSGEAAAGGAVGQLAGEKLMGGVGKALSATRLPQYAEQIAGSVASRLQSMVPAWKGFPVGGQGLKAMLYSQEGWNRLHQFYDASLKEVVKKGSTKTIQVSMDDAKALGIREVVASADPAVTTVGVNAGRAAEAITGAWKKNPRLYAQITDALDHAGVGDPAARKAYKTAMGLRAYLNKQGAVTTHGTLDLLKAQAGLTKGKSVDELLKRGLGEFATLLAPGGKTIEKRSLAMPLGVLGGALGGAGGHSFGLLPIGSLFGAYHGARLGQKIPTYSNVPPSPIVNFLQRLVPRLGAAAGGQAGPKVGP